MSETDEVEGDGEFEEVETIEEPFIGPDALLHIYGMGGAMDAHIEHWLDKVGFEDCSGSCACIGENASFAILNPKTGDWMTHKEIIKAAPKRLKAVTNET